MSGQSTLFDVYGLRMVFLLLHSNVDHGRGQCCLRRTDDAVCWYWRVYYRVRNNRYSLIDDNGTTILILAAISN